VSTEVRRRFEPRRIPVRILVAGSGLLAGALANALEANGFATRQVVPREPGIKRGIEWQPNLVLVDVRSLDIASGSALIREFCRVGLAVCVIDAAHDDRLSAWRGVGASAWIDRSEPFEQLFRTVTRLLQIGPRSPGVRSSALSVGSAAERQPEELLLQRFTGLTEREQSVLAELMEGHCAEEIANSACVSISTVRSQIKAILQKLSVKSQLAAVALARRAGWAPDSARSNSPRSPSSPRARVS
jgi:DNA-binding NarL/FixJ family response regulator